MDREQLLAEAKNLFEYLAQVQRTREKPVRTVNGYEDVFWLADFPVHVAIDSTLHVAIPEQDAPLFTVDRVLRHDAPTPDPAVAPWIVGDLGDVDAEPILLEWVAASRVPSLLPRMTDEGPSTSVLLEDEPQIQEAAEAFFQEWETWAEKERIDRPIRDLYTDLFAAYSTATSHSESFELVLGVGSLSWALGTHEKVQRHLLTFPVALSFDDKSGRLTATRDIGARALSVELDMLDPALITQQVTEARNSALAYEGHPLHRDLVQSAVMKFAHALDARGAYLDEDRPMPIGPELRASFAPALILRRRSQQGMLEIFQTIGAQLDELGEVPPGLLPLIDPDYTPSIERDSSPGGIVQVDDEVFLPLPVNERQLRVIEAIDRKAQVVVQGPPGTGKTHTAAALLSHLLAQGKRVLVTAHTDRALHEVRDKLPAEIRPLSVAVVGNSQSELTDLRVAVETINRRADEHDAPQVQRSIERHLEAIDRLRRERAQTYSALRQVREAETEQRSVGPYAGTLAAIAQEVESLTAEHAWIEDVEDVPPASEPPLTSGEALEWLRLVNDVDIAVDEAESGQQFPALEAVPTAADLAAAIDAASTATTQVQAQSSWLEHPLFPDVAALDDEVREALHVRTSRLAKALGDLESRSEGWVADAVQDIRTGRRQPWQARADQVALLLNEARPHVIEVGPVTQVSVASDNLAPLEAVARSLLEHLGQGNKIKVLADGSPKIGAFTSKVVKQSQSFFDSVRVNGLPVTTVENLRVYMAYAKATQVLDALDRVWPANITIPEEDTLDERLQWHVTELHQLGKVLAMADQLTAAEEWVKAQGLKSPNWADLEDVQTYAALVEAAASAEALDELQMPLEALHSTLSDQASWNNASPVVTALTQAVASRDRNAYADAHGRLAHLHKVREKVSRRDALRTRLTELAPGLAAAVQQNSADAVWGQRLASLDRAWAWASAVAWLAMRDCADVNKLKRRLDTIEKQIRGEIAALAADRAWSHAVDESRMSGTARAHLAQYASLVRRLGKGTGKYAEKQRQEIRAALDQCRPSVPVWIMPIYRIAEQFRIESNMFDVVLVDEASQAGLEASFLQYLAPKIVVIGDDKQVSPSAVGVDQQQLRDLANQYLADNPFKASWQDPKRSYFDEATMRFGGKITLVEHRRCVPEIIGFSNKIAYEPENIRLIPVRQRVAGALTPVRGVHVPTGYEKGKTNPAEADALVAQLVECAKDPAYEGMSFGVISLMGKEQAKLIETKLLEKLPPEQWAARDVRCGDAADFQGSERDVVFLSMVKAAVPGRRIGASTSEMYVQRYNVAASRAKEQMWLFHSLMLSDLGRPDDMRHALLEYVANVESREAQEDDRVRTSLVPDDERVEPFDSLFEQRVFNRIHSRGYSVIPQYPAEGYRIDLVVVGANGYLAVECDGDHWHGPEAYRADLARQRDLERCGWTFFRMRESSFYLDPEEAMADLWPQLEALTRVVTPEPVGSMKMPAEVTQTVEHDEPSHDVDDWGQGEFGASTVELEGGTSVIAEVSLDEADTDFDTDLGKGYDEGVPSVSAVAVEPESTVPGSAVQAREEIVTESAPVSYSPAAPYRKFQGPAIPTHLGDRSEIVDDLVEAVRVEGPVRGGRLLSAYVRAAGGQKVGSQIAKDLNSAIAAAVRAQRLVEENPLQQGGVKPRTYRLPDQPRYVIRDLGPRALEEVPPLELAARIRQVRRDMGGHGDDGAVFRAVMQDLGLRKLTPNVHQRLGEAAALIDQELDD